LRPDVLHIQYQTAAYSLHPAINLLPLCVRLLSGRPLVVVTFHDLRVPYLFPKAGRIRWRANLCLARWSDAAIATNQEDLATLAEATLPTTPRLIHIGSNIEPLAQPGFDREAWRSRYGIAADEILLCYFGFLNQSKGGETLLQVLAELRQRGRLARLLMIGGQVGDSDPTNASYLERFKRVSAAQGLDPHIQWTGYVAAETVSAWFWAADACVLPYADGVSLRRGSLMAALAHGVPTVSTVPPMPIDKLTHGDNILLVRDREPSAIADAVESIADRQELRARLSSGASRLALCFTWDQIAAETVRLYEELGA
jgi:glycosyltransferase involved in cell wall biosynthesis